MIKEDYVSFEVAKLLKEKGFDEKVNTHYLVHPSGFSEFFDKKDEFTEPEDVWLKCPTHQMAMKWLREEYNLFIEIQCYGCEANEKAHFEFSYVISEYVQFDNKICTTVGLDEKKAKSRFKSYEEACEAAIKYCLEHLI